MHFVSTSTNLMYVNRSYKCVLFFWCFVFLLKESSGSARTDYRAIQLAKRKKQKGPAVSPSTAGATQRKTKAVKGSIPAGTLASGSAQFGEGTTSVNTAGLTIRDPVTGVQYVQIQLLQVSTVGSIFISLTLLCSVLCAIIVSACILG